AAYRAVLDLRLSDRRLEVDVPHRGRLEAVDVPLPEEVVEAQLGQAPRARIDGGVLLPPVDREPEPAPERLEGLLVLAGHQLTDLDEVRPRDDARHFLQAGGGGGLEREARLAGDTRIA